MGRCVAPTEAAARCFTDKLDKNACLSVAANDSTARTRLTVKGVWEKMRLLLPSQRGRTAPFGTVPTTRLQIQLSMG